LPDKVLIALLLNNLNKDYNYIVAIITRSIRTRDDELNLDAIISQLLDEARTLNSIKSENYSFSSNLQLNNNYKANSNNSNNKSYNTDNCQNNDGDIEMTLNTRNNNNYKSNKARKQITCSHCSIKGHKDYNCCKKYPNLNPINKSINNTIEEDSSSDTETVLATFLDYNSKQVLSSLLDDRSKTIDFILYSGATIHTCYLTELFTSIQTTNTFIKWDNTKNNILASGIGNISIKLTSSNKLVTLTNVLFVPELGVN
jgi:hypothetical protein